MRFVEPGTIDRPLMEGVASAAPDDPLAQDDGGLVSPLGWAVLLAALAAHVLVVLAVRITHDTSSDAVTAGVLAQLPVLAVVIAGGCFRPRDRTPSESPGQLGQLGQLGTRAAEAEAALVREHDRVHELRATLAGVVTACRVLEDPRTRLNPVRRSRLKQLHDREMERLERLLTDRHDAARSVDLDAVIDPLVESLRMRGIEVSRAGAHSSVHARPDDVIEVVHILLENAAQHAAGRPVEVAITPRGSEVEIRVADRGPGIPPDVLPRIFERNVRGAGSSGQGLGLNIARRLAHEMGGQLRLAPSPAGEPGTTFVVTLPAPRGAGSCHAVSS